MSEKTYIPEEIHLEDEQRRSEKRMRAGREQRGCVMILILLLLATTIATTTTITSTQLFDARLKGIASNVRFSCQYLFINIIVRTALICTAFALGLGSTGQKMVGLCRKTDHYEKATIR